jgi:hypothetical protein
MSVAMLPTVRSLLELIRFSHTLFALPFALTSAVLAWKLSGFHASREARRWRLIVWPIAASTP